MTQLLPPKKEVALALLERSNVDVYLDPRAKGVVVPPQFRKEPRLILKIGLNMPVPIPDLRLDDESLSCTLSFNRSPFYCVVPWPSVFAMVGDDGRGMVWPDDVPQELAVRVVEDGQERMDRKREESSPDMRPVPKGKRRAPEESRPSLSEVDRDRVKELDRPSRPKRGGAEKKKKKEERPAPVLVAVPARERERDDKRKADDRKGAEASERRKEERLTPPKRDANGKIPPPSPSHTPRPASAPGNRPKRELPPYLRVVK
jgi:stringent starvation protein B